MEKLSSLLTIVGIAVPILYTWHLNDKKHRNAIYTKQLETVYHPVFVQLEQYIYKYDLFYGKPEFSLALATAHQIIAANRLLASPYLYMLFELFAKEKPGAKKKALFDEICKTTISQYSDMRRSAFLSTLSVKYRKEFKLYKKEWHVIFANIKLYSELAFALLAAVFVALIATFLLNAIMSGLISA